MSQTYTLDAATFTGTTTVKDGRTAISNSAESMRSSFAGTTAPTSPTPVDGQLFFNTTSNALQIYSDSSWRDLFTNVNSASAQVSQVATWHRILAAGVVTANFFVISSPTAFTVLSSAFYSSSAVATDATNYYTIKCRNIGTGGAGTTDIASKTTNSAGGTAITANTAYDLGTISSAAVAANEMVVLRIEVTAAPTALNLAEAAFFVRWRVT